MSERDYDGHRTSNIMRRARESVAAPERDPAVEESVREVLQWARAQPDCPSAWSDKVLRRAVHAGREPLLKRIEELEREVSSYVQEMQIAQADFVEAMGRIADAKAEGYEELRRLAHAKADRGEWSFDQLAAVEALLRARGDK